MISAIEKIAFLLTILCLDSILCAYCSGKPNPDAKPNLNPIDVNPYFQLIHTVEHGKKYLVGSGNDSVSLIHVYGTPYEMGLAHGQLMKDEISVLFPKAYQLIESQIDSGIQWVPTEIRNFIALYGLEAALDFTWDATEDFTGSYIFDELRGISDGSGYVYDFLVRIHMMGELTQASCSMSGAWGAATPSGSLIHLRAFDWNTKLGLQDYPLIIVYHPSDPSYGHNFTIATWAGYIATFSGVSSQRVAVGQIGVTYPDASFGSNSRFGIPFYFLLRDILQFDVTLDDAINRMTNADRTCANILGVSDGKLHQFKGMQYSYSVLKVFDDENMEPNNDTWHPRMKNVMYWGMDWLCPNFDIVFHRQLQQYYGNITAENLIKYVVPIVQTGNLQTAIFDYENDHMYISNAKATNEGGPIYSYDRQFLRFDMEALFQEPLSENTVNDEILSTSLLNCFMPEEYLDILDEEGNLTGESKPRSVVHKEGHWHRVTHVWIVNSKGELILQKRSDIKESFPGLWDISSAGHISAGEIPITSGTQSDCTSFNIVAQRELEEELGINVKEGQLEHIFTTKIAVVINNGKYINKEFVDVYLLKLDVDLNTLKLQEEEVSAVKYVHHKILKKSLQDKDPSYVPCDFSTGYGKLFDVLEQMYS